MTPHRTPNSPPDTTMPPHARSTRACELGDHAGTSEPAILALQTTSTLRASRRALTSRRASVQRTGLVIAGAVALIAIGVVTLAFLGSSKRSAPPPLVPRVGPGTSAGGGSGAAPLPAGGSEGVGTDAATVGAINRARVQFVDKNDPTRLAGVLRWTTLDPLPGGRANVTEPRGLIYLRDGRVISVRAERGTILRPARSEEPESGTFEGKVRVELFEPTTRGQPADVEAPPALTLETQSLRFDRSLYEASTGDRWSMVSDRIRASGRGIRLVGNDVNQRLELGEFDRVDEVVISPRAKKTTVAATSATPAPAPIAAPVASDAKETDPQALVQTLYRAQAEGGVTVAAGARRLRGELAEVWVRLVGNQLPDGALGVNEGLETSGSAERAATDGTAGTTGTSPGGGSPSGDPRDEEIRLTWTGRMVIRPLEIAPPALESDDAAIRISSPASAMSGAPMDGTSASPRADGTVEFSDRRAGISGVAGSLVYGATSRNLNLVGSRQANFRVTSGERAVLIGESLRVNLGSGVAQLRGPGEVQERAAGEGFTPGADAAKRLISWTDQADLEFFTRGPWMTGELRRAAAQGSVLAKDSRSALNADFLEATFTRTSPETPTFLSKVSASGNATARTTDTRPGAVVSRVSASSLSLGFTPPKAGESEAIPSIAIARGDVQAQRAGSRLMADSLEATLEPDARGQIRAASVNAGGNVRYLDDRGIEALSDRLTADPVAEKATLIADLPEGVRISQRGAVISARQVSLDAPARQLSAFGPGRLTFQRSTAGQSALVGAGDATLNTTWTSWMTLSDKTNNAEFVGDVRTTWIGANAASTPGQSAGAQQIERIAADRLDLRFTQDEIPVSGAASSANAQPETRRQISRATASGRSLQEQGGARAQIESLRIDPVTGARRLIFLEGDRIIASETDSTLSVPGPGRLLVDERPAGATDPGPDASTPGATSPANGAGATASLFGGTQRRSGSSLFSWTEQLTMSRATGEAELSGGVRLIHRPMDQSAGLLTLESDKLAARVDFPSTGQGSPSRPGATGPDARLINATARGSVVAQGEGQKRVLAELMTYDAINRTITAEGGDLTRVTLVDPARASPVGASKIVWNLVTDRVDITRPTPLTVPR